MDVIISGYKYIIRKKKKIKFDQISLKLTDYFSVGLIVWKMTWSLDTESLTTDSFKSVSFMAIWPQLIWVKYSVWF